MKKSWIVSLLLIIVSCAFVFSACSFGGGNGAGSGDGAGSGSGSGSGSGEGAGSGNITQTYYAYFLVDNNVYRTESTNGRGYVTFPEDPQKDGYGFDGWWVGSEQKTMLYNQTEDISLTAKFKPIFTVESGAITGLTEYGKTLSEISIPSKIDGVNISAISGISSTNLQSVKLTNSIKRVDYSAFSSCSALNKIDVESAANWFNSLCCFSAQNPFVSIGVQSRGYDLYVNGTILTSLTITSDFNMQYGSIIDECKSIKSLTIDSSVETLAMHSLDSAYVKNIYISDLKKWCDNDFGDAVIYTQYNLWLNNEKLTTVNDPTISKYNFTGCQSLQMVVMAEGTKYQNFCFENCGNLTIVVLPKSVTTIYEDDHFWGCNKLESIFYCGSQSDWQKMTNNGVDENKVYFYSETDLGSTKCWHFVNGVPTIW